MKLADLRPVYTHCRWAIRHTMTLDTENGETCTQNSTFSAGSLVYNKMCLLIPGTPQEAVRQVHAPVVRFQMVNSYCLRPCICLRSQFHSTPVSDGQKHVVPGVRAACCNNEKQRYGTECNRPLPRHWRACSPHGAGCFPQLFRVSFLRKTVHPVSADSEYASLQPGSLSRRGLPLGIIPCCNRDRAH